MSNQPNKQIIKQKCKEAQNVFVYTQSTAFQENVVPEHRFLTAQKQYPNFAQKFPIPLLMMTDYNWFIKRVFKRWLEDMINHTSQGLEGFCEVQAEYAVLAYKHKNKDHSNLKDVYNQYYNLLFDEYNKLKKMEDQAKSDSAQEFTKMAKERTDELYQFLINKK